MKKLIDDEETKKNVEEVAAGSSSTNNSTSSPIPASALESSGVINIQLPSNPSGSSANINTPGSSSNSNQSPTVELDDADMVFEEATTHGEPGELMNESQLRQSTPTEAINIPIVTSTS